MLARLRKRIMRRSTVMRIALLRGRERGVRGRMAGVPGVPGD